MNPTSIQVIGAVLFALAVLHTFSTKFFERLAHSQPRHAGIWHLLGEVEVVFGFWAMVLMLFMFSINGKQDATAYLDGRNFTEPLFVFAIMVIAGTRPILQFAGDLIRLISRYTPLPQGMSLYFLLLSAVPLLGSFITEPAAMTLAALMLRDCLFSRNVSTKLKYSTLGVLFVNISIGGTLTPFAAPPVLMVAAKWNWDIWFMIANFGWKAAVAVLINAACVSLLFRKELSHVAVEQSSSAPCVPQVVVLVHLVFLTGVVVFGHHPAVFLGLFLFFLGFTTAYQRHQSPLILREAMLVAFFLGGLVVGPPGTGKTTTLIRRLGQKLDTAFLEEGEQQLVEAVGASQGLAHANSWLMFTPTELLKQYLKEAFAREGVPASDLRIRTWQDYRRELARNAFGVLRTATGGSTFVLKEGLPSLSDSALVRPIDWFEEFDSWQRKAYVRELDDAASLLQGAKSADVQSLGGSLKDIVARAGEGSLATTFGSLVPLAWQQSTTTTTFGDLVASRAHHSDSSASNRASSCPSCPGIARK